MNTERFKSRSELLKVPRFGQKAFEQAAGFLRIRDGVQPLDNSAVHPEQYPLVKKMAANLKTDVKSLIGNEHSLSQAERRRTRFQQTPENSRSAMSLHELARPGRDPRSEFKVATFSESINEISDLQCRHDYWKASSPMSQNSERSSISACIRTGSSTSRSLRIISSVIRRRSSLWETSSKSRCWKLILNDAESPYPENQGNSRLFHANGISGRIA